MTRTLVRLLAISSADELGSQMLNVAIGWYLYSVTQSPMSLAYAGLAQFLPNAAAALAAGHVADQFERREGRCWCRSCAWRRSPSGRRLPLPQQGLYICCCS
jgi:MFS family permease